MILAEFRVLEHENIRNVGSPTLRTYSGYDQLEYYERSAVACLGSSSTHVSKKLIGDLKMANAILS